MTRTKLRNVISVACLLSLGLGQAQALDWGQWRGPQSNGLSMETGWNGKALATPKVLWRIKLGRGHSAIAVAKGFVYTMGENIVNAGGRTAYEEVVYCLDSATGKVIWRYAYPCQYRPWPGPGSTPTVDGGFLYTFGRDGDLICFNASNGRVIWKRNVTAENLARLPNWQHCASPTVAGELLLINGGRSGIAFNKKTGKTVWASPVAAGGLSTPILFDQGGKKLAAINGVGTLSGVEVATGKVEWTYPWGTDCDPVFVGKQIYLCGGGRTAGSTLLDISAGTPKKVWESPDMKNGFISGVPVGGYMYVVGMMGRTPALVCVDLKTGAAKWQAPIQGDYASLMAADGKLIILNGAGTLIVAEASPVKYNVLSQARILTMTAQMDQQRNVVQTCWTAPVLANGKIYVRDTFGNVACVDVSR